MIHEYTEKTRSRFENEHIYYRQFLNRHNDGTYVLEWVESLWRGWCMAVSTLGLANETE